MPEEQQTETTEQQATEQVESAATETTDTLGDAGKKALEQERAARKAAEKEAKRVKELEAELEQFRTDAMSEQERAIEQARKEAAEAATNEAQTAANERLFKAEVKAASAGKLVDPDMFADPLVAQRLLGFDEVPVDSDGDIDSEAISEAVDRMLEAKPHLAVSATRPAGDVDQGARPGGTQPSQLTRADLRNMTPEQIVQAEEEGRMSQLLGRS